jgi:hypothetical protein
LTENEHLRTHIFGIPHNVWEIILIMLEMCRPTIVQARMS